MNSTAFAGRTADAALTLLMRVLIADRGMALLAYTERLLSERHAAENIVQETAQMLGMPAGTVKSRHHYALRRLQARPDPSDPAHTRRSPGEVRAHPDTASRPAG